MTETAKISDRIIPYLKSWYIFLGTFVVIAGGLFAWKGPTLVKNIAKSSLEQSLRPLGIEKIEIDSASIGLGRIYLRDIRSKASPSTPTLNIQEMNVGITPFFRTKALEIVGATIELPKGEGFSFSKNVWQEMKAKVTHIVTHVKRLKLPAITMQDCLIIIPTSTETLKIPVHVLTQTTLNGRQILTVDWGEPKDSKLTGQLVLETNRKGMTVDILADNVDFRSPYFQIKAPEISLWATTAMEDVEGCSVDGFVKLDHLLLASYGSLKSPLDMNIEATGTLDNLDLDEVRISERGSSSDLLEVEGTFKPNQPYAQFTFALQVPQISKIWNFTRQLAAQTGETVSADGQINVSGEVLWEGGHMKSSALTAKLKDISVSKEGFSMEGVSGEFVIDSLYPVVTKSPQRFFAPKLMMAGIDFKKVALEWLFDETGLFQIKNFSAEALDGTLKAHRFQREIDSTQLAFQFEADFENIELAKILQLTDLESLSGHGTLAGNALMRYGFEEGLDVLQGELHSTSNTGLIQYKPKTDGGKPPSFDQKEVNMALQVLDNLNFSLFNVRLQHVPNNPSEMQGIVKMLGSNPNVLNGYPFEFNIVTTGKLKDLVENTLLRMKPPVDISKLEKASAEVKVPESPKATQASSTAKPIKKAKVTKVIKKGKKKKNRNRKLKNV